MRVIKCTWIVFSCLAFSLRAQTTNDTNVITRPLSLEEGIRLALEHNLRIQIARYDPGVAGYRWHAANLAGSYGYYDPIFNSQAQYTFSQKESSTFQGSLQLPPSQTKVDDLTPKLSGKLPTGLLYELNGDFRHVRGTRGFSPFDEYDTDAGIVLTQPLLRDFWIDAGRLRIKLAKKDLKISEHNFLFQVMDVINQVQQAYYELMAARDDVNAREKALELAQRLVQENRRKVEVGTLPPLDEKQAESQAAARMADLILARQNAAMRENAVKNLITDNYEEWRVATVEPTERLVAVPESYDLGTSWLNGLTLRPDFNALKEGLEKQGIEVRFRFNQLFPALDVVGTYGRSGFDQRVVDATNNVLHDASFSGSVNDIRDELNPRYSAGFVLTFPLSFRADRNNYKAAKIELKAKELGLKQKHQEILVQIDDAIKLAQANFQRVEATRQARIYAETALEAEQKKLENGKSTSFNVLLLQRDLTTARFEEIRALADYNKAQADLHFKEGTTLEKNRVTVEIK